MKATVTRNFDAEWYEIEPAGDTPDDHPLSVVLDLPDELVSRWNETVSNLQSLLDMIEPLYGAEVDRAQEAWALQHPTKPAEVDPWAPRPQVRGPRSLARKPLRQIVAKP